MLSVRIEGDTVVVQALEKLGVDIQPALNRGLRRIGPGLHRAAYQFLSGPGSKASRAKGKEASCPGSYPVPVVTNNLREKLNWLGPGESISGDAGTFTAGQNEIVLYDSAAYHYPIFAGTGSSAKFGPRNALTDGLARFNSGNRIQIILEDEVKKEIQGNGLG